MKQRLVTVWKEMNHARDVAAADQTEARACRELLHGEAGVLKVNCKITKGLRTQLQ